MDTGSPLVDWRCAEAYAALADGNRHVFAWEWLRRSTAYRKACEVTELSEGAAACFGLHRLEPAEYGMCAAQPVWRADVDPHVVVSVSTPGGGGAEAFDFAGLACHAKCVVGPAGTEHWLWSEGFRNVRLDVIGGTLRDGPVRIAYRLAGFRSALPPLTTIERLIALTRTGTFVSGLFPPERRAHRWSLVLRTHDALAAGASQREIAEHLFALGNLPRWRIEAPSWRQRVQRLVAAARVAARIEPSRWLCGTWP